MTKELPYDDETAGSASAIPLTPVDIEEFRALVEAETGVALDAVTAWNRAAELIALVRVLTAPLPEDPEIRDPACQIAIDSCSL